MEDVVLWSILVPVQEGNRAMQEMFHAVNVARCSHKEGWCCPSFTGREGNAEGYHSKLVANACDRNSAAVGQSCRGASSWFSNLWFTVFWHGLLYGNRKWLSLRAESQQHTWTGCLEKINHLSEATNCSVSKVGLNFQRFRLIASVRRIQLIQASIFFSDCL